MAKGAAKTWTSMKLGSTAARTAKKAAKAYGSWKVTKFLSGKVGKVLLVPLALVGGLVAWKKVRSSGDEGTAQYGSATGPAASPQTVTPPKQAPGSPNGEAAATTPHPGAAS